MDRDLVTELYVGVLDVLSEEGGALCGGGAVPAGVADRLALTAYLIVATHSAVAHVVPSLLESLRCEIRAATIPIVSGEVTTLRDDAAQLTKGDSQDAA